MRIFGYLLGICILLLQGFFQGLSADEVILRDEKTRIGYLDNGLVYYIRENDHPKGRAELRLVVKAGSLHEEESQRGLAHMLEHLVFRGSENFSDHEVSRYLESIGAQFGVDLNAYTTFDHTCYELDIPLHKKGVLEKGVLILSDFAGRALLEDEMIRRERTVVLDEFNIHKKTCQGREIDYQYNFLFKGSRFDERMTLGLRDVIVNAPAARIREFYHKWYRPDRMAVIAVGDFDAAEVEAYIKKSFGDFARPEEEIELPFTTQVDFPVGGSIALFRDKELGSTRIDFAEYSNKFQGEERALTRADLRSSVASELFSSILNERYEVMTEQQIAPPFLFAFAYDQEITTFHTNKGVICRSFEGRPLDALKAAYGEVAKIQRYGVTEHELLRAKVKARIAYNAARNATEDHASFVGRSLSHFLLKEQLNQETFFYVMDAILEIESEELESISSEEVREAALSSINLNGLTFFFSLPDGSPLLLEDIEKYIEELNEEEWQDESTFIEDKELLLDNDLNGGSILSYQDDEEIGYREIFLQNGMKVILQPTEFVKNEVVISLYAKGGRTLFSEDRMPVVRFITEYLRESGLANLNGRELNRFLSKTDSSLDIGINLHHREVEIWTTSAEKEESLKLIYALFMEKRMDNAAWKCMEERHLGDEKYVYANAYSEFSSYITSVLTSGHYLCQGHSISAVQEEDVAASMQDAFSSPSEFTVVIVGDFSLDEMQNLVVRYLGSIAESEPLLKIESLPEAFFPRSSRELALSFADKEVFNYRIMTFTVLDLPGAVEESYYTLKALSHIVSNRMLDSLRHEMGSAYTVHSDYMQPFYPDSSEFLFVMSFTGSIGSTEEMKHRTLQVIENLYKEGPTRAELESAKEILLHNEQKYCKRNSWWTHLHRTSALSNRAPGERVDYNALIDQQVSAEAISTWAKALFEETPLSVISLEPDPFSSETTETATALSHEEIEDVLAELQE